MLYITRFFFYKKVVYKKVLIFLSKFKKVYINRTNYFKKVFKKGSKKQDIPIDQNTIEKLNKKQWSSELSYNLLEYIILMHASQRQLSSRYNLVCNSGFGLH